ncbi:MAG: FixH family protein [Saprospiraceae bacterium]
MKFNWGFGIAAFYTLFALTMVFFVIKSTTYDNSLVFEDYYAKDLNYQEHYDRVKNSQSLTQDLDIKLDPQASIVDFRFPEGMESIKGEIQFYNPVSQNRDFSVSIATTGDNQMIVPVKDLPNGRWKIKVNWESSGKTFYKEKEIYL